MMVRTMNPAASQLFARRPSQSTEATMSSVAKMNAARLDTACRASGRFSVRFITWSMS